MARPWPDQILAKSGFWPKSGLAMVWPWSGHGLDLKCRIGVLVSRIGVFVSKWLKRGVFDAINLLKIIFGKIYPLEMLFLHCGVCVERLIFDTTRKKPSAPFLLASNPPQLCVHT